MAASPRILIVEDEEHICTLLRYNLEHHGYLVELANDGDAALNAVSKLKPDLVLLDWMLPKLSGIEVCRILRSKKLDYDGPIIIVTAKGEEADKVRGLETGADDYITKPFSMAELLARIQAQLRRTRSGPAKDVIDGGEIIVDHNARKVFRRGRQLRLGPTEYRLLHLFVSNPGQVFNREELLNLVWGAGIYVEPRTVDVHICGIQDDPTTHSDLIATT